MDTAKMPDWFLEPYTRVPQEIHQASFSCTGRLQISIRTPHAINKVSIHPLSRRIDHSVSDNVLTFTLEGPQKLYIQIDDLPPLFIFANPIEHGSISPNDHTANYFGPGVHRPGTITLKDSETVYIAAGAIVYGAIRANGVTNIRVMGRGILDGGFEFTQMVLLENCTNVLVEGVMIRNGDGWTNTLVNCERIQYNNVKVLSFGPSCDGVDPLGSRELVITDCFFRCTDDCIAIKAPAPDHIVNDIYVTNCTMIGFAFSDGITIGFETNAVSISNVVVRNCDVILARGGSRVDGHSGFSIICDGPAVIHNILFDNIRVEKSELKLFELNITDGTKYGTGPPGHIKDIRLKDISWAHTGPIVLKGLDENHRVEKVTFENCTVAGKPLQEFKSTIMQIGHFVDDLSVK
jgi:polygalacturonase